MPAAGAGMAALSLLGLVGVVRARRARRKGKGADEAAGSRPSAAMETERRMAAYLASRGSDTEAIDASAPPPASQD